MSWWDRAHPLQDGPQPPDTGVGSIIGGVATGTTPVPQRQTGVAGIVGAVGPAVASQLPPPAPAPSTPAEAAPAPVPTLSAPAQLSGAPGLPPPTVLQNDPAYLAYVRALGLEDSLDATQARAGEDSARQGAALQQADLDARGVIERRNIAGAAESRGVYRSSAALRGDAEQRAAQGRTASGIEFDLSQQIADLANGLARARVGRATRLSEIGLTEAANLRAAQYPY